MRPACTSTRSTTRGFTCSARCPTWWASSLLRPRSRTWIRPQRAGELTMAAAGNEGTRDPHPAGSSFLAPGFAIEEELLDDGGTRVLSVSGELDLATGPVLGQRIRRPLFWEQVTRLVVDLAGVTFIDSSGTNALVLSHAHADALDRDLRFVCPEGNVLRRLSAYGLQLRLPLYATREEALAG